MDKMKNCLPPKSAHIRSMLRTRVLCTQVYLMVGARICRRVSARIKFGLLLAFISFFNAGCWDVLDIEKRDLITGMALDLTSDGQVQLTAQIPIPKLMLPNVTPAKPEENFYTISVQGASTFEAFALFQTKTPGHIDIIKTNTILFSEEIAKKGISPYLDTIARMPKFPTKANLMITKGHPGLLLKQKVAVTTLPSFYLMYFFESPQKSGMVYPMKLWRFLYKLDSPAIDPYLPVLDYNSEEKVFLPAGLAALSGDTLAAYLSPEESKIFGLLSEESGEVTLSTQWRKGRVISIRHVNNRLNYQWLPPRMLRIKMKATGYLLEETGATLPLTPSDLSEMEKALAKKVKSQAEELIKRLQTVNSDPIGLGRVVRAKERQKWSESYWRKLYPSLQIRVDVDFTITRSGQQN